MNSAKPLLKWAGGKRQLIRTLTALIPRDFDLSENRYHEPFVGGGALFFSLASQSSNLADRGARPTKRPFVISDSNDELINFYKVVQDKPEFLIRSLSKLAQSKTEADFYRVRQSRPTSELSRAARFLYLNRLCFNGLYRVNSRGEFNVPYGNYKKPVVVNREAIRECSLALNTAEIRKAHFRSVLTRAKRGDLVYFDPPYIPLSKTASFSKYAKEDFTEQDHRELAEVIEELTSRGVRVILSNSDTALSREIFSGLTLFSVPASRAISASPSSRVKIYELLGVNFRMSMKQLAGQVKILRVA